MRAFVPSDQHGRLLPENPPASSMTTLTRGGASGDGPVFSNGVFVFSYKIYGALSDSAGLPFNSCVPNLQNKPELWADECPYIITKVGQVEVRLAASDSPCSDTTGMSKVAKEATC